MKPAIAQVDTSMEARRRLLALPGEPLFQARWDHAVFLHYECDPETLQASVPFSLDLYQGRAFVSVVAFTMQRMRPRLGGAFAAWLFRPVATHHFLNVRAYVRHNAEPGIYFMTEWLSNRLSVLLGPITFGLPYRFGRIDYHHGHLAQGEMQGSVRAGKASLNYRVSPATDNFERCEPGSLDEFLLERYTAYTCTDGPKRFFRVWHEPWQQQRVEAQQISGNLLRATGPWFSTAHYRFGNYSAGAEVWMGWPHRLEKMALL